MEAITAFNSVLGPQRQCRALSFRLFPVRVIAVTLAITLTVIIVCARELGRYSVRPTSPFASFADIFPGKPADMLTKKGYYCVQSPYTTASILEHCNLKLETGSIAEVIAIIKNGKVFQVEFALKQNLLKLGDLMLCLGMPQKHHNGHITSFIWQESGVYASVDSDSGRFFPAVPLSKVSFTDSRSPSLESLEKCLQSA